MERHKLLESQALAYPISRRSDLPSPASPQTDEDDVDPMAEPLELVSGIAGIITLSVTVIDVCVQYYSGVAHAHENITNLTREIINLKSVLSSIHDNVVLRPQVIKAFDKTPSAILEQFTSASPDFVPASGHALLSECKATLERIHAKLIHGTSGGSTARKLRALAWPFSEKDVQKDVDRLHRCANIFQAMMVTDNLVLGAKMHSELQAARKEQQQWHLGETESDILGWLSPLDFESKHSAVASLRHPGTDEWFIGSADFVRWSTRDPAVSGTLWVVGHPGVGKTVLSSLVIDYLKKNARSTNAAVAYVYCDYDSHKAQTATAIIGSICSTLVEQCTKMPEYVTASYRKARNGRLQLSLDDSIALLVRLVNSFPSVFIIFDGLDELEDKAQNTRKHLVNALHKLAATSARLLITSRPYLEDLGLLSSSCTRVEINAQTEDIRRFVVDTLDNDEEFLELLDGHDETRERLIKVILEQAGDGFLLPTLHLNRIKDCTCAEEIDDILGDTVGSLDDVYQKALERIQEQPKPRRMLALLILSLISGTRRPLQLEEMQEAIAVRPDRMGISRASFRTAKMMLQVCVGLVTVDSVNRVIRFVHMTFQEFIHRHAIELLPDDMDRNMAERCLSYLQFDAFKAGPCLDDQTFEERLRSNRFYHYAATHWGHHVKSDSEEMMLASTMQLVRRNPQHLSASIQARHARARITPGYSQTYPKGVEGLCVAAGFGLKLLAQNLLEEGAEVDAKTSVGDTALHEAARNGHAAIMAILIEYGAQVDLARGFAQSSKFRLAVGAESRTHHYDPNDEAANTRQPDQSSPNDTKGMQIGLAEAAKNRDLGELKRLLSAGASAQAVDARGRSALHWAIRNSDDDMATMLLTHGADVNFRDGFDKAMRTPLLEAARSTSLGVTLVRTLLEHGADPNLQATQWGAHYSPLHETALLGDSERATLLLEFGANERLLDKNGQEAIDIAVARRNLELVEILAAASMNRGHGETALHLAAAGGHLDAAKVLIQNGSNLDSVTSIGETPLHWAVSKGQLAMATLLIDAGASADVRVSSGETALHVAAAKGDVAAVHLLTQRVDDANILSGTDQTPLHAAAAGGIEPVVSYLLGQGADPNAHGKNGATPLIAAAGQGHVAIVAALLAHGADVSIHHGYDGKTALHRSGQAGHVAVTELLLQHGADIEARDDDNNTPLRLASSDAQLRSPVLECLLSHRAQTEAVDVWGETPLQRASFKGHFDNVRTLLKHGANPEAEDPSRWTEHNGSGWPFLERVATSKSQSSGWYKTMDVRGWPGVVQAALMGNRDIVALLLASKCGSEESLKRRDLLSSLAEYRHDMIRARERQGLKIVVEGGWTDIELKATDEWVLVAGVESL
ncbi:hypothetical protein S7711_01337 [Stachybotrys chartarum IBT 7711]|uniref:NACHT domain-containing protein n=1 Tax=Stachybotrys chartarum (strain CBS 109288 / IBT 7711) TaxID=1280523 RepID=A0A084BBR5_STACB|nr:hypothetical protein S7711_01337 [Stachybotrys chartarum IBT 7711]